MIDILKLRKKVIEEYHSYVDSFLDIRDERLKAYAHDMLNEGKLWPDPLLQCNPGFEKGETVDQLIKDKVLHSDMASIFTFPLHKHQSEAIKLGSNNQGFIVTSGTGSGKSLTYLGTIFNRVLQQPDRKGVTAIIVYPMNALINSQEIEIQKFATRYEEKNEGHQFPITFGKYTGQEDDEARQAILDNPPHILLTNFMMLELLLTRSREADLRASIFAALQFLVFDELHTYRGRQGADVALLIRRIKALCSQRPVCMGTSATLSSGSLSQQKLDVIHLGKQLFDEDFQSGQIVMESLQARISRPLPDAAELKDSLSQRLPMEKGLVELEAHPLTCWMEQQVALADNEGKLVRGTPQTLDDIAKQLALESDLNEDTCRQRVSELLQWLQQVNQHMEDGILPFRVHQFVSQTGTIRVTLESASKREITAEELLTITRNGQQLPLFPVVFNRHSGLPYIRVQLEGNQLKPRENGIDRPGADQDDGTDGYVLLDERPDRPLWDEERAKELIPDTWIEKRKSGDRIRKDRAKALPKRIWFQPDGTCSFDPIRNATEGWFMTDPLVLDPVSGVIYDARIREFNKLAQLGDAGRSMSTTILTYSTLHQLENLQAADRVRKVMSFTDNRQDAALQSGHFNDFMRQVLLRAAICTALEQHECRDTSNIAAAVFDALALPQEQFAEKPGTRPYQIRNNEDIFKKWLLHQLFYDLRRGWRHRLPNLEQCGLLEIRYKNLREDCDIDKYWTGSDLLHQLDTASRFEFLRQFLNYFRSSFAVKHHELERNTMEESRNRMRDWLKPSWMYQHEDAPREPYWMRLEPLNSNTLRTQSIGPSSSLGQYMRFFAKKRGITLESKDVAAEMPKLLDCLTEAGYLYCDTDLCSQPLYRLELSTIEWVPGKGKDMVADEVRNRSVKEWQLKPNEYFKTLYQQLPDRLKQLEGREHTGQVPTEKRVETERDFREAKVKALFCSPTMELGIDIDELAVVHMRNVPPNPANYAQRSGRAGRKGQGALIFTFCSEHSAHDRHFFRKKMDMVTGKVSPQTLDLCNPDLLRTHLNAAYLAKCKIPALNRSLAEILDLDNPALPLIPAVIGQLELSFEAKAELHRQFSTVIAGLRAALDQQPWFSEEWITHAIEEVPRGFNDACQRWRDLYTEAFNAKAAATAQLRGAHLTKKSPEYRSAMATVKQSQNKLDLLRHKDNSRDFSEFYPYRYLASEGFLPGYNFTRLPVRMYLNANDGDGTYISRPRLRALVEFGPQNTIYQNGSKWQVSHMMLPPSEGELHMHRLFIDKSTGYYSLGDATRHDVNPFSDSAQGDAEARDEQSNLIELQDMTARETDRISCQEDERTRSHYTTELGFQMGSGEKQERRVALVQGGDALLDVRFLPTANLIRLNLGLARNKDNEGFLLHALKGRWESDQSASNASPEDQELIKRVRLYTSVTADCLYIAPQRTLNLSPDGVVTLMFALKEAMQQLYHVEPQELACMLTGDPAHPNILFYESAEGSLGILTRLTEGTGQWEKLIATAHSICRLDENELESPRATYDDLLSYYNQRYHKQIDRFAIRNALESLRRAETHVKKPTHQEPVHQGADQHQNDADEHGI